MPRELARILEHQRVSRVADHIERRARNHLFETARVGIGKHIVVRARDEKNTRRANGSGE